MACSSSPRRSAVGPVPETGPDRGARRRRRLRPRPEVPGTVRYGGLHPPVVPTCRRRPWAFPEFSPRLLRRRRVRFGTERRSGVAEPPQGRSRRDRPTCPARRGQRVASSPPQSPTAEGPPAAQPQRPPPTPPVATPKVPCRSGAQAPAPKGKPRRRAAREATAQARGSPPPPPGPHKTSPVLSSAAQRRR